MYEAYFMNTKTGELKRVGSPKEKEKLDYFWMEINSDEYDSLIKIASFYFNQAKNIYNTGEKDNE